MKTNRFKLMTNVVLLALLGLSACNSGKTSGGGDANSGDQFVATDDSVGSISLDVTRSELGVGSTSGFLVTVKDADGAPVAGTRISCDSEDGIAIIEPTTGAEITDGFGTMSGVIGCEVPGSLKLACRLPVGANRRKIASIKCTGDVPQGFTGWPGAAGGGLGGGVDVSDDDGPLSLRLTNITVYDSGDLESGGSSVDIVAGTCGEAPDTTPEPFFDAYIGFTITNGTNSTLRVTRYRYTMLGHQSPFINFIGEAKTIDAGGGTGDVTGLFLDAEAGGKRMVGRSSNIGTAQFANVSFLIEGVLGDSRAVTITGRATISLDDFDRCG